MAEHGLNVVVGGFYYLEPIDISFLDQFYCCREYIRALASLEVELAKHGPIMIQKWSWHGSMN